MALNTEQHPCFSRAAAGRYGRVHIPIAPACNVQCNFCGREYDCVNESRPGVTSRILTPGEARDYVVEVTQADPRVRVVGVAGPGDAFANPRETLEALRAIRSVLPDLLICVSTNGLELPQYLDELLDLQVSHVTVTVNAVSSAVGARVYEWVLEGGEPIRGEAAAQLLWARQAEALGGLRDRGIMAKVNTIVIPGVNDHHVADIARAVAEAGADLHNCIALLPTPGTPFEGIEEPRPAAMAGIRAAASALLPQMSHCTRCRADAVGLLGSSQALEPSGCPRRTCLPTA